MEKGAKQPEQVSSCRAIIVWKGKILLHHRDNKPDIPNPDCWSLPGGGIEEDETPAEGITRELKEEASYSPKNLQYIGYILYENGTKTCLFFTYIDTNEAKLFKKGIEGQGVGFFTLNEIDKLNYPSLSGKFLKKYKKVIEKSVTKNEIPSPQTLGLII